MERLSVIPQEKEASARKRGELESGRKILERTYLLDRWIFCL